MLIRSILAREKLHERFSASAVFPAQNRMNSHSSKMFCFNHASASYTNNKIVKNVDEKQIQSTKSKPEILPEIQVVMI